MPRPREQEPMRSMSEQTPVHEKCGGELVLCKAEGTNMFYWVCIPCMLSWPDKTKTAELAQ